LLGWLRALGAVFGATQLNAVAAGVEKPRMLLKKADPMDRNGIAQLEERERWPVSCGSVDY
jgi:hypothetical protein